MSTSCNNVAIPKVLPKAESPDGKRLRNTTLDNLPFLQYALENIFYHTNLVHIELIEQTMFLESFPFATWRRLDNAIARFTRLRHTETVSQAYILAEQGCSALLAIAMQSLPLADEPEERCRSILGAAVDARDIESVLAVLSHKGYEKSLGKDDGLCMAHAIESDELEIVQALVAAKSKPYKVKVSATKHHKSSKNNALVLAGSQPQKFASSLGRFGLLRLIFGSLSGEDKFIASCTNAVQYALEEICNHGDLDVFNLLYEWNTLLTVSSHMLCDASHSGNEQLVRSILRRGVNINGEQADKSHGRTTTPLSAACEAGHEHIARLLLLEGASHQSIPCALIGASERGHERVIRFLLGIKDVESIICHTRAEALVAASRRGQTEIIRILLERFADAETPTHLRECFQTALHDACQYGHLAVARLLAEHGAEVDGKESDATTPLNAASAGGHLDIVQMLLENGADINLPDYRGMTPLINAIMLGHPKIARLLIEHGADIHRTCEHGRTALWWTPLRPETAALARLLKDKGAYGQTATLSTVTMQNPWNHPP
jgi:ankyrin repeat protein